MLWSSPFCIRQETDAAKFVSNGMCQFHVLQNRNAYLQCWRTWNKGKTDHFSFPRAVGRYGGCRPHRSNNVSICHHKASPGPAFSSRSPSPPPPPKSCPYPGYSSRWLACLTWLNYGTHNLWTFVILFKVLCRYYSLKQGIWVYQAFRRKS